MNPFLYSMTFILTVFKTPVFTFDVFQPGRSVEADKGKKQPASAARPGRVSELLRGRHSELLALPSVRPITSLPPPASCVQGQQSTHPSAPETSRPDKNVRAKTAAKTASAQQKRKQKPHR